MDGGGYDVAFLKRRIAPCGVSASPLEREGVPATSTVS